MMPMAFLFMGRSMAVRWPFEQLFGTMFDSRYIYETCSGIKGRLAVSKCIWSVTESCYLMTWTWNDDISPLSSLLGEGVKDGMEHVIGRPVLTCISAISAPSSSADCLNDASKLVGQYYTWRTTSHLDKTGASSNPQFLSPELTLPTRLSSFPNPRTQRKQHTQVSHAVSLQYLYTSLSKYRGRIKFHRDKKKQCLPTYRWQTKFPPLG